jgi:hypothetical protein
MTTEKNRVTILGRIFSIFDIYTHTHTHTHIQTSNNEKHTGVKHNVRAKRRKMIYLSHVLYILPAFDFFFVIILPNDT